MLFQSSKTISTRKHANLFVIINRFQSSKLDFNKIPRRLDKIRVLIWSHIYINFEGQRKIYHIDKYSMQKYDNKNIFWLYKYKVKSARAIALS